MSDVRYVELHAGKFLNDTDILHWDAEKFGMYCSLIFYLYENGGAISVPNTLAIAPLCRCVANSPNFDENWREVSKKFVIRTCKNGFRISHKRVTMQLKKAHERAQVYKQAGLKGAQKRWGS